MKHQAQPQPPAATPAVVKAGRVMKPADYRNAELEDLRLLAVQAAWPDATNLWQMHLLERR